LLDIDNESGTRDAPASHSIDLTAAEYQEINSITFRYYPLATNGSIEFNNLKLNGSVVNENPGSNAAPVATAQSLTTEENVASGYNTGRNRC